MPRPPRIHVPGGCYHLTLRGNHREALFATAADRQKLTAIVVDAIGRFDIRVHAYCWMTNHLHAVVQVDAQPLSGFVKSVATRYSRYRHKALDTSGHLFERRYGARLVAVDSYFLTVLRYIHLNPVEARIVNDPADYPWSSHRAYLGTQRVDWLRTDLGLSLLSEDPSSARVLYAEFIAPGEPVIDIESDAHARSESRQKPGEGAKVKKLRQPAAPLKSPNDLDSLAAQICAEQQVPLDLLRSKSSLHTLTQPRLTLLDRALTGGIANLTEVARYLRRDASTLAKQWRRFRDERLGIEKTPKIQ